MFIHIFKAATSYDGLCLNYRVVYIEDASRGVDCKDIEEQKRKLVNNGALMVNSKQVIIQSKDNFIVFLEFKIFKVYFFH